MSYLNSVFVISYVKQNQKPHVVLCYSGSMSLTVILVPKSEIEIRLGLKVMIA